MYFSLFLLECKLGNFLLEVYMTHSETKISENYPE